MNSLCRLPDEASEFFDDGIDFKVISLHRQKTRKEPSGKWCKQVGCSSFAVQECAAASRPFSLLYSSTCLLTFFTDHTTLEGLHSPIFRSLSKYRFPHLYATCIKTLFELHCLASPKTRPPS